MPKGKAPSKAVKGAADAGPLRKKQKSEKDKKQLSSEDADYDLMADDSGSDGSDAEAAEQYWRATQQGLGSDSGGEGEEEEEEGDDGEGVEGSSGDEDDDDEDLGLLPDEFGEEQEGRRKSGKGKGGEPASEGDDDGPFAGGSDDEDEEGEGADDDDSIPSSDLDGEEGAPGGMIVGHSGDGSDGEDEDEEEGDEEAEEEDEEDEEEERRGSGSKAGASGGFMQGAKGASFAKAFSKLVEGKAKTGDADAPILAASKSVAKRQAEDEAEAAAKREAKKARLERRRRGHVTVPRKGEDPQHDLLEKGLGRLATRGVVLLFNAIAKAQKQTTAGGAGSGAKPAKLSKASFLAQLKGAGVGGTTAAGGTGVVGGGGVLAAAAGKINAREEGKGAGEAAGAAGWKVLQAGFTGLSGGGKMKDWDRKGTGSDEEDARHMGAAGMAGTDSEGDDGDDGW